MRKVYILLAAILLLALSIGPVALATSPSKDQYGKEGVCHATGSEKNPYVYIEPDKSSAHIPKHLDDGDYPAPNGPEDCEKQETTVIPPEETTGSETTVLPTTVEPSVPDETTVLPPETTVTPPDETTTPENTNPENTNPVIRPEDYQVGYECTPGTLDEARIDLTNNGEAPLARGDAILRITGEDESYPFPVIEVGETESVFPAVTSGEATVEVYEIDVDSVMIDESCETPTDDQYPPEETDEPESTMEPTKEDTSGPEKTGPDSTVDDPGTIGGDPGNDPEQPESSTPGSPETDTPDEETSTTTPATDTEGEDATPEDTQGTQNSPNADQTPDVATVEQAGESVEITSEAGTVTTVPAGQFSPIVEAFESSGNDAQLRVSAQEIANDIGSPDDAALIAEGARSQSTGTSTLPDTGGPSPLLTAGLTLFPAFLLMVSAVATMRLHKIRQNR